jgi:hypothetical protein
VSLLGTARKHWLPFAALWVFPFLFLGSALLPSFAESPKLVFLGLQVPAFFLCMYVATAPIRRGAVGPMPGAFWVIVVPFLIWASLIFGLFGLAFLSQ